MSDMMRIRISGPDGPGITAGLMAILADDGAELFDVEQVVVRGHLTLGVLVSVPEGEPTLKDLLYFGWERGLEMDFEPVTSPVATAAPRSVVTVLGSRVGPDVFGVIADAIAANGGNIERIVRLSRYPVVSYELAVTGADAGRLRQGLLGVAAASRIDVAIQPEGLARRAKRMVVLDVDSTLVQGEAIDLLAREAGVEDDVADITGRAMAGELDFASALCARVGLLAGLDQSAIDRVYERLDLTAGAHTFIRTLHRLGMRTVLVSGGFTAITDRLRERLGVDRAYANVLEVADGRLTGRIVGPVLDRARKAVILQEVAAEWGIPPAQVVAVGDGANDLDMLAAAGLGIAFNAKPVVKEAADTALNVPYLDAVLFLLGVSRDDVEAADAADGLTPETPPVDGLPPL